MFSVTNLQYSQVSCKLQQLVMLGRGLSLYPLWDNGCNIVTSWNCVYYGWKIEVFIKVFWHLKQYKNFRPFFIVYNLAIEAHLQIFEAYCSNFWPVIWWSALFNHKWCFTCYVWVLKNSFNWYHLIFCVAYVPYNWSLQYIQIYSICHCQPCNACKESNSR